MINDITPDRIANAIMQDNTFEGLYVLVEGNKDFKLFSKFLNLNNTRIKQTFGRNKLLKAFELLCNRGFERKIGIIDRDFCEILGNIPEFENIFITDYHDIEVMIIMTKAFDNVLSVFTVPDKIRNFETKNNKSLKHLIFELSDRLGYLKLANKKYDLGLVFKPHSSEGNQIKYHEFITDSLDYKGDNALIKTIINYSRNKTNKTLSERDIKDKFNETASVNYASEHLSNGHDLSNIIFIFLKKTVKSSNKMLQDFNCIEDSLILAYDFADFKKSKLYKEMMKWSKDKETILFDNN
jgi:hypothetical protein